MKKLSITIPMIGFVVLLAISLTPSSSKAAPFVAQADEVIVYAMPYETTGFSTWVADSYATAQWNSAVYATLFSRSAADDRDWIPDLAAAPPVRSVDGLQWNITLREGLRFSNGHELTSSDVLFSLKTHLAPAINVNDYGPYVGNLDNDSITIINDLSFTLQFRQPYAFLYDIAAFEIVDEEYFGARYDSCVMDAVIADCVWNAADGSDNVSAGPFVVESIDSTNEVVTVVANPYYYRANIVKADKIVFEFIEEPTPAISALASGDIDIMDSQYFPALDDFDGLSGITDPLVADPNHQEISLNHIHPVWGTGEAIPQNEGATELERLDDARLVRYALTHVVARDYAVNQILGGAGIAATTIMPSSSVGWDSSLVPRNYSIDTAKVYMEMAGYDYTTLGTPDSNGVYPNTFFDIDVLSPNTNQARNQWAAKYVDDLPKIGIGVTHHSVGWDIIEPRTFLWPTGSKVALYPDGGYDMLFVGNGWALNWIPTSYFDATGSCIDGDCGNFYNFDLDENITNIAQLTRDYVTEVDFDARDVKVKALQAEMYYWEPVLPIVYTNSHWGLRSDVTGVDPLLLSVAVQEWDLVGKTGFKDNTPSTATSVTTNTQTTSVTNTKTVTKDSPVNIVPIVAAVFFSSLVALNIRRKKNN
jgi:ABC-type transport system substrate-binding protein